MPKEKASSSARKAETAKAGKRKRFWTRPPRPTRSAQFYDARSLRRQRLNGAFGAAPIHVWNHLITGTNGREKLNRKQLSALAMQIRIAQQANLVDEEEEAS